jgi:P27 family predicted phage terminase small subunit
VANPRISDEQKKARGTFKPSLAEKPLHQNAEEKKPRRPSLLTGYAAKYWDKNLPIIWEEGTFSARHLSGFVLLCETYSLMKEMQDYCDAHGYTYDVTTKNDTITRRRPEYDIFLAQQKLVASMSAEYGLTPVASKRLPIKKRAPQASEHQKLSIVEFIKNTPKTGDAGKLKPTLKPKPKAAPAKKEKNK